MNNINKNNNIIFPIVVLGRNRTMMTIEAIKQLVKHVRYPYIHFIIGSDRSDMGHVEAIEWFMKQTELSYEIFQSSDEHYGLGYIINEGFRRAFRISDCAMMVENDMLLQKDIDPAEYINMFRLTNIGNIDLRSFNHSANKSNLINIEFNGRTYFMPIPNSELSRSVQFGINIFSRKFVEAIGLMTENSDNTDIIEEQFVKKYNNDVLNRYSSILDGNFIYPVFNTDAPVQHVGITSQHANVTWNKQYMQKQYWYLNDMNADRKFRNNFII